MSSLLASVAVVDGRVGGVLQSGGVRGLLVWLAVMATLHSKSSQLASASAGTDTQSFPHVLQKQVPSAQVQAEYQKEVSE